MVTIDFKLADELAQKARLLGILNDEKLSELIEAEVKRQRHEARLALSDTLKTMPEAFDDDSELSEDNVLDMIQEIVDGVRTDIYQKRFTHPPTNSK